MDSTGVFFLRHEQVEYVFSHLRYGQSLRSYAEKLCVLSLVVMGTDVGELDRCIILSGEI